MNIETLSPCSRGKVELIPIAVFVAHYPNSCLTQVRISVLIAQYCDFYLASYVLSSILTVPIQSSYPVAVTFVSNRW